MKLVVLYVLAMPFALLGFAAASVLLDSPQTTNNPGPTGCARSSTRSRRRPTTTGRRSPG